MQLTVQFVNQPNKNPKFGSIKATDGNYYDISADHLHKYRNGMTFDAPVKGREYKGKTYYSIPDSFDPNTVGAIIPQPNGHVANNSPPRQNGYVDKDVLITTVALMKSFIETGQQPPEDITALEELCLASAKRLVKAAS